MSNFKFKKSEFMDLNMNKKAINEVIEDINNNGPDGIDAPEGMDMPPMDAPIDAPMDMPVDQTAGGAGVPTIEMEPINTDFLKLVSCLFHSSTQVHIFHLQTKSYSEHNALNTYYDEIVGLTDGLIESFQGKYDILKGYENFPLYDYKDNAQIVIHFKQLLDKVDTLRASVSNDSYLQNQIDNVVELITSTLYKLRFLH
jgi:hypothetical protein